MQHLLRYHLRQNKKLHYKEEILFFYELFDIIERCQIRLKWYEFLLLKRKNKSYLTEYVLSQISHNSKK